MLNRLLQRIKSETQVLAYRTGWDRFLFPAGGAGSRILMFHNILPQTDHSINMRNLGVEDFRRIMHFVKKNYEIRHADEIDPDQKNNRQLAITFDDGLINNLRYALPVLEELQIPATFFIPTTWLHGRKITWPDELSLLLKKIPSEITFRSVTFRRTAFNQFRDAHGQQRLEDVLLKLEQDEIDSFLNDLRLSLNYEPDSDHSMEDAWRVMKGEEIKLLSQSSRVKIGSHALSHKNLCMLPLDEVREELCDSRKYLEQVTGGEVKMIAFPFGLWNQDVLNAAIDAGYSRSFGVENLHPECLEHRPLNRLGLYNFTPVECQMHTIRRSFLV